MHNLIYWGAAIIVRIIMPSIILNLYFNALLIPKEAKHLAKYFAWFLYMGWQYLMFYRIGLPLYLKMSITTILVTIICLSAFEGRLSMQLALSTLFITIGMVTDLSVSSFFVLFGIDYTIPKLLGAVISNILMLLLSQVVCIISQNKELHILSRKYAIMLLFIPAGSIYILYILFYFGANTQKLYFTLGGIGVMLAINVIIFNIVTKLSEQARLRMENAVYAQQLELMDIHTAEKEAIMLEFRNVRHDMKQHLCTITEMIERNEITELKQYITELLGAFYPKNIIVDTGNIVIDALINAKYAYMQQNNIKFNVDVKIPHQLPYQNIDISILIGNMLDNAIEASEKITIDKRQIDFAIQFRSNILTIQLGNYYNGCINKDSKGQILTTKTESENHGIGFLSINKIVMKYNGKIDMTYNDNYFRIKAMICGGL